MDQRWLFRDIWHSRLTHSEQNKVDIELYEHNYNMFQESIIMILLALLFRKQQRKQVRLERRDAKNEELGRPRAVQWSRALTGRAQASARTLTQRACVVNRARKKK